MPNNILITSYVEPDLDGTACAVAYAEFLQAGGQKAEAALIGAPHEEVEFVFKYFGFAKPPQIKNAFGWDKIILVDASDTTGLEGKVPLDKVIEIIDHRQVNELDKFPNAAAQIELVGAAATLVAEKFIFGRVEISKQAAPLLACAIISNTLNFNSPNTTKRDHQAFDWLNKLAKLPDNFARTMFLAKSNLSGSRLATRLEKDLAHFEFGGHKIGITQIEMIGAEAIVANRSDEITATLAEIKQKFGLEYIFLNLVELEGKFNIFITDEPNSQRLIETVFKIKFSDNRARLPRLIMRKQIWPLVKAELEKVASA